MLAAAEERIKQSKVLRGDAPKEVQEESLEDRRRRQELIARYEEKDELEMTADGKVIKHDLSSATKGEKQPHGVDRNDNAERVRQEEEAKREKLRQQAEKQKELIKKDDSKKKREEKKEDRRKKAQKHERKGKGM